ncbi:peroxiredoxin [Coraliomargarita sp. SDUM461004]|uniref:thioredoxin-dependent peroxiredoxin n=1 Tax=Thalassobacterium sedimentorum TaxID=3041258 RepID=A0ABU1AKQ9_9BACT|nr:peroxiredoxin [Coraliomargarita sp. SDUM461004]MDQ8194425.1 peroxiredoxin [Coraliomargarita sp. SDUM461004]
MLKSLTAIMIFSFLHSLLFSEPLEIGSSAPQIQAINDQGESIDLGAALARGTTLVFFYPKAMTMGCTAQACSLRDAWDELQSRDVQIFGVSTDKAELQAEFRAKHTLPFTLIADPEGEVCEAFGKGRYSRQAYIFKDGTLVWRDLKAATSQQAAEVLAALDELQNP